MKKDLPLEDAEKRHLRTETIRLVKSWKVCKDKDKRRWLSMQFNIVAQMYIDRCRDV